VAGSCEDDNEPSGSINSREFFDYGYVTNREHIYELKLSKERVNAFSLNSEMGPNS
jgi:hypothetical protein